MSSWTIFRPTRPIELKASLLIILGFTCIFTPTYSSWLNQVELWFAKIERDVIARDETAQTVDEEIRKIIDESHAEAKKLLREKRTQLDALVQALLEHEPNCFSLVLLFQTRIGSNCNAEC